jgi:hypothetical protein
MSISRERCCQYCWPLCYFCRRARGAGRNLRTHPPTAFRHTRLNKRATRPDEHAHSYHGRRVSSARGKSKACQAIWRRWPCQGRC